MRVFCFIFIVSESLSLARSPYLFTSTEEGPRRKYILDFSLTFDYYEDKVIFHQYSIHFNHAQINVCIYKVLKCFHFV